MRPLGDLAELKRWHQEYQDRVEKGYGDPRRFAEKTEEVVCDLCGGAGALKQKVPGGEPWEHTLVTCPNCRGPELRQRDFEDMLREAGVPESAQSWRLDVDKPRTPSQRKAWALAEAFVKDPSGVLWLHGAYQTGKSFVSIATANELISKERRVIFRSVPKLLGQLREGYESEEQPFSYRWQQIAKADVLILDDFGAESSTNWSQEKLFEIFNDRMVQKLGTIVTTNLSTGELLSRYPRIGARVANAALNNITVIQLAEPIKAAREK